MISRGKKNSRRLKPENVDGRTNKNKKRKLFLGRQKGVEGERFFRLHSKKCFAKMIQHNGQKWHVIGSKKTKTRKTLTEIIIAPFQNEPF